MGVDKGEKMISVAQALRTKNQLVSDIANLENRIKESSVYTQGCDQPIYSQEDFYAMIELLKQKRDSLVKLKKNIDQVNHVTINGTCIFEQICLRGEIKSELDFNFSLREWIISSTRKYYDNKNTYVYYITIKQLDEKIDFLKAKLVEIDNTISNLNACQKIDFP